MSQFVCHSQEEKEKMFFIPNIYSPWKINYRFLQPMKY